MQSKYLIWYHNEDNDGVFSAAIIYNYLVHEMNVDKQNITLEGTTYNILKNKYSSNDDIEHLKETYSNIILTDVSFNDISKMKKLKEVFGNNFIWIDHHKPIIDESYKQKFDDVNGWRDTSRSAILNAYRYFYDPLDEKYMNLKFENNISLFPELLRILSAYDSWSFKREKLREDYVSNVNKGVTVFFNLDVNKVIEYMEGVLYGELIPRTVEMKKFIAKMSKIGKQLVDYDVMRATNQIREYGDFGWTVNGRKTVMIMFQGPSNSHMFVSLKNTEYKNGFIMKRLPSGEWNLSLYNINEDSSFHCGEYMKKIFGGGGHAGAAGAVISEKKFLKLLKTKTF